MDKRTALIGTAKGLIVYEFPAKGKSPILKNIHFSGFSVTMLFTDHRHGRWWVGLSHNHWGQKLHFSDNEGRNWMQASLPTLHAQTHPNNRSAKLRKVWCMAESGLSKSEELWMGTDPGALFHSENNGKSFQLVTSLWNHPSRQKQGQWSGTGSDHPFIHSIIVDPDDPDHVYVAVSSAGVFESIDGGQSWIPRNKGLKAVYLPNPHAEVGHDPHLLLMSPVDSKVLWQQNHCGIYHSKDGGLQWVRCSNEKSIPHYGFCIAIDEQDPAKAWVIPVQSDEQRIAPELKLNVFQTPDYGNTWYPDSKGLPYEPCFDIVLRHCFVKKGELFVFGTTNGNLFYRHGINHKWLLLNHHLTKVNAVVIC